MIILTKEYGKLYKIVLLGDGAVGKTTIRKQYLGAAFKEGYSATIGIEFAVKRVKLNNTEIICQIWDIAGQRWDRLKQKEDYGYKIFMDDHNLLDIYLRGASGIILMFDITNPTSFENLSWWIEQIARDKKSIPMVLCGNKIDLKDKIPEIISSKYGLDYAHKLSEWSGYEVKYFETSAKTGEKVNEAFHQLISSIIEYYKKKQPNYISLKNSC